MTATHLVSFRGIGGGLA